jgi:hypothetical protein
MENVTRSGVFTFEPSARELVSTFIGIFCDADHLENLPDEFQDAIHRRLGFK